MLLGGGGEGEGKRASGGGEGGRQKEVTVCQRKWLLIQTMTPALFTCIYKQFRLVPSNKK